MLFVKSGGHLRDHAAYRTASSAESLQLSASALLAALHSLFGGLQLQRYEEGFHDVLGLQRLHAVPHSVRHAGPSEDAFHKRVDLAAIQRRGRWGGGFTKSVVRFEKGAKLPRQLSFVPERLLKKARSLEFRLPSRVTDALSDK